MSERVARTRGSVDLEYMGPILVQPRYPRELWRHGEAPEAFRALERLFARDPHHAARVVLGEGPAGFREKTLADHHAEVDALGLSDEVPGDIRAQYDTARNLLVVGWFLDNVIPVAELHAITTLECALRSAGLPAKPRTPLRTLFDLAIESGRLRAERFRHFRDRAVRWKRMAEGAGFACAPATAQERRDYLVTVAGYLREVRNAQVHEATSVPLRAYRTFGLCADAISQLAGEP